MTYIGIDLETYDPHLTDKGVSWVYGEGHIICTSLYFEKTKKKECFKGVPEKVKAMMLEPSVVLVGANIIYDLGWLENHFGIHGQTKATLCDVIIAEGLIDEYGRHNLEYLGQKYLHRGKVKSGLEAWAEANGKRGDFRKHLKDAPWNLVKEYALDDAELPVLIYRKQEALLAEQNLSAPFNLDCMLLKVVLKMKQRGVRIDVKKKNENKRILEDIFREKEKKFIAEYGKVNFNSPKQVAQLMDRCDVNYNVKLTLKGRHNRPFGWADLRSAKQEIDEVVKGFRRKKDKLVAFIEKKYKARMCEILDKAGYQYTANPTVDKKFLALVADEYPVTKMIQDIKQVGGILSKFLGEGFDRYIVNGRVHCDFNVANTDEYGTISGRLSCLAEGTLIATDRGTIPIENVESGDVIVTHTGKIAKVAKKIFNGIKECVQLTTAKGSSIICTTDHLLFNGNSWQKAAEIEEVSIVSIKEAIRRLRAEKKSSEHLHESGKAYCCTSSEYVRNDCSNSEEDCCGGFARERSYSGKGSALLPRKDWKDESNAQEDWGKAPQLERFLRGLQRLSYYSCGRKKILRTPSSVRQGSRSSCKGLTVEYDSSSHRRRQIEQLDREFSFNDERRSPYFAPKVESIRGKSYVGKIPVFDLSIESDDHSFVANGFLVHNCSAPNLQQIPSKGVVVYKGKEYNLAQMCRELFIPEKDCWMLKIDYSQIEYRLLVHYACGRGADEARQRFNEDPSTDYHQFVMDLTGLERKFAKNCNFGIMYGMGPGGMQEAFGWSKEHVDEILADYHEALPYVSATMQKVSEVSAKRGFITTIGGRKARLRNKDMTYTMLNRLNQGGSADIMKASMVEADERGVFNILSAHITVHDELVCSVPKTKKGIEAVQELRSIMENIIKLRVPIIAEPELGDNWYDVKDMDEVVKEMVCTKPKAKQNSKKAS